MRSLILSFCLLATTVALPLNFTVTPDLVSKICDKANKAVQEKYLPEWVVKPVCDLPAEDKEKLINYINAFHDGKLAIPSDTAAWIAQAKTEAPAFGNALEGIYNEAKTRWSRLPQHAQELIRKYEQKGYTLVSTDRLEWFTNILMCSQEFLADVKTLSDEDWAGLRTEFPEYCNAWDNNQKLKTARLFIEKLPQNFNFNSDPEVRKQLFEMTIADMVPAQQN